jgi:hypothetical protein
LFIDGLTHLNGYSLETPYPPSKAPTAPVDTLDYKNKSDNVLKSFYNLIKGYVKKDTLLILDDISVLLYNGFEVGQVNSFILQLKSLIEKEQGTLLTVMHTDEECIEDIEQDNFIKNVIYGSNIILQVQPLNSGLARDVHGQLDIIHGSKTNSKITPQSLHYKILDNNVHFFAKGVSQV